MRQIIKIFLIFLLYSCTSQQFTYKESDLIKQKEKIQNFVKHKKASKGVETFKIKEIIKQLNLKPLKYSCLGDSEAPRLAIDFTLYFYEDEEYDYRFNNKMQFYDISMDLVNPLSMDKVVLPLFRKSRGVWTKEVEKFYENVEVKNIRVVEIKYAD